MVKYVCMYSCFNDHATAFKSTLKLASTAILRRLSVTLSRSLAIYQNFETLFSGAGCTSKLYENQSIRVWAM